MLDCCFHFMHYLSSLFLTRLLANFHFRRDVQIINLVKYGKNRNYSYFCIE